MSADSWREIAETTKMNVSEYEEVEKPETFLSAGTTYVIPHDN